jgi:hypothetical protein
VAQIAGIQLFFRPARLDWSARMDPFEIKISYLKFWLGQGEKSSLSSCRGRFEILFPLQNPLQGLGMEEKDLPVCRFDEFGLGKPAHHPDCCFHGGPRHIGQVLPG